MRLEDRNGINRVGGYVTKVWRWSGGEREATVVDLSNSTSAPGGGLTLEDPWFQSNGDLHVPFIKSPSAESSGNPTLIVEQRLPAGSRSWDAPDTIAVANPRPFTLRRILVNGTTGILWSALDAKYGQATQTSGAWLGERGWSDSFLVGDGEIVGLPAPTQSGPSCVATNERFWILGRGSDPVPLRGAYTPSFPTRPVPVVYQSEINGCIQPIPLGANSTSSDAGTIEQFNEIFFAASQDSSMQIASIDNGAVSTAALQVTAPTAPGPVQDLKMRAKQGRKTVTLGIAWSAPKAPVNPDPNYKVRVKVGSQDAGWVNAQARTSWIVRSVQPKAKVVVQVKAVNTVGESPIRTVRYRPGR